MLGSLTDKRWQHTSRTTGSPPVAEAHRMPASTDRAPTGQQYRQQQRPRQHIDVRLDQIMDELRAMRQVRRVEYEAAPAVLKRLVSIERALRL